MNTLIYQFNRLKSVTRLLICLGLAILILIIVLALKVQVSIGILVAWASFSFLMSLGYWITFFTVSDIDTYMEARQQDETSYTIFSLVLLSVCISLAGILILMRTTAESTIDKDVHRFIALLTVALSWILLHTIFTLHYAHVYYEDDPRQAGSNLQGLDFPKEDKPDYLDFAYFSFVIGMTFQVSDVEVTSKRIRKMVLLHGFISFIFNTIIVALTISVLSNSGK